MVSVLNLSSSIGCPQVEVGAALLGAGACAVKQVENNCDREVYNGDLGIVQRVDDEEAEPVVTLTAATWFRRVG